MAAAVTSTSKIFSVVVLAAWETSSPRSLVGELAAEQSNSVVTDATWVWDCVSR